MPSLPNISGYSNTGGITNFNIKNLDVVSLDADLVSTADLVIDGVTVDYAKVVADITDLDTRVDTIETHFPTVDAKVNMEVTGDVSCEDIVATGNATIGTSFLLADSSYKCLGINHVPTNNTYGLYCMKPIYNGSSYTGNGNINIVNYSMNSKNIVVNTSLLKTDSTNTRVGINNASPAYTLDVGGNMNVMSGSDYKINGTSVLNATTLGSGVVTSSLTSIGQQTNGVDIVTGQAYKINGTSVLDATTLGSGVVTSSLTSIGQQTNGVDIVTGQAYKINGTSVLNATTLGSGVVTSSLTSIGQQTNGVNISTGQAYKINGTSVLNATTLGSGVTNASLSAVTPSGGTFNLTGDAITSGYMYQNNPMMAYYRGTSAQSIGGASWTGVAWPYNEIGTTSLATMGLSLDATNCIFTNTSGYPRRYTITCKIIWAKTLDTNFLLARIVAKGRRLAYSQIKGMGTTAGDDYPEQTLNLSVVLANNETFTVDVYCKLVGSLNINPASPSPASAYVSYLLICLD